VFRTVVARALFAKSRFQDQEFPKCFDDTGRYGRRADGWAVAILKRKEGRPSSIIQAKAMSLIVRMAGILATKPISFLW
jgi:hypothetical protein